MGLVKLDGSAVRFEVLGDYIAFIAIPKIFSSLSLVRRRAGAATLVI